MAKRKQADAKYVTITQKYEYETASKAAKIVSIWEAESTEGYKGEIRMKTGEIYPFYGKIFSINTTGKDNRDYIIYTSKMQVLLIADKFVINIQRKWNWNEKRQVYEIFRKRVRKVLDKKSGEVIGKREYITVRTIKYKARKKELVIKWSTKE